MKKIIATTMTCSMLAGAGMTLSGCSLMFWKKKEDPTLVPFSTISSGAYQSFVKNWDDKDQPVLCALIRSSGEWNYWFQPAATMRHKNALAPSSEYFETRQLMLATRVVQAPDSSERGQIFTADKVTMRGGVLKLEYRFVQPASGATYQIKDFLLVEIPKDRYTTGPVQFVENGRTVCEISR
ncbi:hypothetical protein [Herbaspirillum sp. CF444]|uniref:hypothetical protein n=1 Tax=Herbaspirillum sp. CF444 TaxID=1144319 RepID=UPI0005522AA2|nr:hypothetical protein [Herbaspirillum sp. CF444]